MSSDLHIAPANMVIILARTGAILGFAWCLARFAGFFITATHQNQEIFTKLVMQNQGRLTDDVYIHSQALNHLMGQNGSGKYNHRLNRKMTRPSMLTVHPDF